MNRQPRAPEAGNGILDCHACGQPLNVHRVGHPCPAMPERFTVPAPKRGRGDPNSREAIRRRKWREGRR